MSLPAFALATALTFTAVAPSLASPPRVRETAGAREQARLCERQSGQDGAAACRAALALGIGPARRPAIRELLARHLVELESWEELADLFREAVRLDPRDAEAWHRLGATLLFALDQPAEAVGTLQQAAQLSPGDASVRVTLGLALAASRRPAAAAAALEEALRLDPQALDGRPAAQAVLEAARKGSPWP